MDQVDAISALEINFIFEIIEKHAEVPSSIFCSQYAP